VLKSSLIGRIATERLVEQEKVNAQLSQESKEIKRNFTLAQSVNLDLEKKVAELAETLKRCQDERKIAEEDAENSRKELEILRKTYDDDLRMIDYCIVLLICIVLRLLLYSPVPFVSIFSLPTRLVVHSVLSDKP
jgi:hypothetical protein